MKVRCIQLLDLMGTRQQANTWLTVGSNYHVLEILIDPSGEDYLKFRLMSDDGRTPIIARAAQFEAVTSLIPSCWVVRFATESLLYFAPSEWMESGFWERYFEGSERELKVFEQTYRQIVSEDP